MTTPSIGSGVRDTHAALTGARAALELARGSVLRDQLAVQAVPAPTGEERARAEWTAARMRTLGLQRVHIDVVGNAIGLRAGTDLGSPVVVCAHLDTVFPASTPLALSRAGERYIAPGIGDNARGVAAMLAIAGAIDGRRVRTRRPIIFAATTGEEGAGDLRGARALFDALGNDVAAAVILDGPGDDRVIHQALGAVRLRLEWRGGGGHSWANFGVPNAIHAAAAAGARIAALPLPRAPRTTLTVARMGGGLSINAIPDAAWLEVDLRSSSNHSLGQMERGLRHAAHVATEEEHARSRPGTPRLALTITTIGTRPSGEVPATDPLVVVALDATRLSGREPILDCASTDANVPIARGIPTVALGAGGSGGGAHTLAEWYDDRESGVGLTRALTVIAAAAGAH